MFPFGRIWANLVFLSSILVLLIVGVFFFIVVDLDQRSLSRVKTEASGDVAAALQENWDSRVIELARFLARQCAPLLYELDVAAMEQLASSTGGCKDVLYIYIHNADGRVLVDSTRGSIMTGEKPTKSFARRAVESDQVVLHEGLDFIEAAAPVFFGTKKTGTVRIAFSKDSITNDISSITSTIREQIDGSMENTIGNTLLLGVSALVLSVIVGTVFAQRLALPLRLLSEGTKKISAGDLSYRAEVRSRDEVGELAGSFNKMTEDLERMTVSKDYVDNIIKNMMGSLIIASPEGIIHSVNQATLDMLGYDEEKLIDLPLGVIFVEEAFQSREKVIERIKRDGYVHHLEGSLRARDGGEIPVVLSGSIMRDHFGENQGIVCVALDITDRKQSEEAIKGYVSQLEQSNHLTRLYTDILSHDLLNPANIITHMTSLLIQNDPSRDPEEMAMILRNAEKLTQLIRDASDYARVESAGSLAMEEIDLFVLLASVIERLRPQFDERRMTVRFDHRGEAPITANPMIEDIFSNILTNNIKYAPEESDVTVSITDEGASWLISVADEGEGIPDQYKESIFERFERREKKGVKGSGLGLAIARRLVDLHGGRIWVEDASGGGCVFLVQLPKGGGITQAV